MRQSLLHPSRRPGKARRGALLSRPAALAERIERAHSLDPVVHSLSDSVVRALPAGPRTDALHGVPFGQPAHPALVRLPLGCWTSAVLLDLFRGTERAAAVLIAAGVAGTAPAAATGLADWSALHEDQQRVGLVHAICQAGAATLFLGSLAVRAGAGPATAGRCPCPGSPWPASARTSAGTWRCGSARAPATPNRSATCPGWAGTTCAGWANCPTGARCGASSATCPCWCTGRATRSACCQTDAPISEDPSTRAGSWWSGAPPASPAPGTDPPS